MGLFALTPVGPGHWRYSLDFPGSHSNGRAHIHHETEVWFREATQSFDEATVESEIE